MIIDEVESVIKLYAYQLRRHYSSIRKINLCDGLHINIALNHTKSETDKLFV